MSTSIERPRQNILFDRVSYHIMYKPHATAKHVQLKAKTERGGQYDDFLISDICRSTQVLSNQEAFNNHQTVSDEGNNFSSMLLERILLGSSSFRALLYSSTGNRFLSLACKAASSSLSFGTCTHQKCQQSQ